MNGKTIRMIPALALCLIFCLSSAALAAETPDTSAQRFIERMVVGHAAYGDRDEDALEELSALDPDLADKWTRILDLWETPPEVRDELPDDLPDDDTLALVALGFQLEPDGTMREELIGRLDVLRAAAKKYPNAILVCTGGGTAAEEPTATEAGQMAVYLRAWGIDPARIIVEDRSVTTAQNAMFTMDILAERYPQVRQIVIVTSDYHIATGTLLFGAEAILRDRDVAVVSNVAWRAPRGKLPVMFQAGALIELSGDEETAFEIYYDTYDIHELPPRPGTEG